MSLDLLDLGNNHIRPPFYSNFMNPTPTAYILFFYMEIEEIVMVAMNLFQ